MDKETMKYHRCNANAGLAAPLPISQIAKAKALLVLPLFLAVLLCVPACASAQARLAGERDAQTKRFVPNDTAYAVLPAIEGMELVRHKGHWGVIAADGTWITPPTQPIDFLPADTRIGAAPTPGRRMGTLMIEQSGLLVGVNSVCTYGNGGTYFLVWEDGTLVLPYRLMLPGIAATTHGTSQPGGLVLYLVYDPRQAFESIECMRCGICNVGTGIVNRRGEIVLSHECYVHIGPFEQGRAVAVSQDHKFGFIDQAGEEVIPCQYDWAESFSEGKAEVRRGEARLWIDVHGQVLR